MSITRGFTPAHIKIFQCGVHIRKKTTWRKQITFELKRDNQNILSYIFFNTIHNCNTQAMCRSLFRMCSYGEWKTKQSEKRKSNQLVYYACGMCIYRYFTFLFWRFWGMEVTQGMHCIRWFGIVPKTAYHTTMFWYPRNIEMKMFDHWNSMSQAQSQFAVCEMRFFITFFLERNKALQHQRLSLFT